MSASDAASLSTAALEEFIVKKYDADIVPSLSDFIRIPNVSPLFDPEWATNGLERRAAEHLAAYAKAQNIQGLKVDLMQLDGLTSLLYIEIDAFLCSDENTSSVLAYAHFDKQPPLDDGGWNEGLSPYNPVLREDGKLFGRGGGDDGYGMYCALASIEALQLQKVPHSRVTLIIEGSEESGSAHLPQYIDHLADKIGTPDLVVCLDSGCENYDQLWCSSSLRGLVAGTLRVQLLHEGIHSGNSGTAASSFRVARQLLNRLEDVDSGVIHAAGFDNGIPADHESAAEEVAKIMGDAVWRDLPLVDGAKPVSDDIKTLLLNKTWRAQLSVTGASGLPALADAGNVLRSQTSLKLSLRLPPNVDGATAAAALKKLVETDPPYNAKVEFSVDKAATGWFAPQSAPWLASVLQDSSQQFFGKPVAYCGIGGSIPFIGKLAIKFPSTQFVVTGVLGPGSNAHGPNEHIDIPFTKKMTCCVASVLAAQAVKANQGETAKKQKI